MRKQTAMINRNAELTWIGSGPKIGRSYTLLDDGRPTGIQIRHCGHPTALWPYYITRRPEEGMFLHANGKAFYLLGIDILNAPHVNPAFSRYTTRLGTILRIPT